MTGTTIAHTYAAPGNYPVSVLVEDANGDVAGEVKAGYITVEVDLSPVANFSSDLHQVVAGGTVQFTYTGTDGNGPASFQWDFGDDSGNSTSMDPSHAFHATGSFTVTVTVTDGNGDVSTKVVEHCINVEPDEGAMSRDLGNLSYVVGGILVTIALAGVVARSRER